MPNHLPLVASIDDSDVEWVAALMNLDQLDEPRRTFLKSVDTLDVSACPGSGKTTLVVAKLAILARKWSAVTRGVCVLSHTNVAKEEIQNRLAGTAIGPRLHGYPHYIDTIHGFVNRFLAIPWLQSHGHPVTAIDNEITTSLRRRRLGSSYYAVEAVLSPRGRTLADIRIASTDFTRPLEGAGFPAGPHAPTYRNLSRALKGTAELGYFCHDEMFLFGEALLAEHPEVADILARRFPFVLIDEMQDTSRRQNRLLSAIFDRPAGGVCIQRMGDPNQAIFDDGEPPDDNVFPDPTRCGIAVSSSFRFDSSIAKLASKLALTPEPNELKGLRIRHVTDRSPRHTIFVFPDYDVTKVLPAYAKHVHATCAGEDQEIRGAITAVGEVHQGRPEITQGDAKYPATVSHYWDGYQATMTKRPSPPEQFIDCVRKGCSMVVGGDPVCDAVDVVAAGFIHVANQTADEPQRSGARPHRVLERWLLDEPQAKQAYRAVLTEYLFGDEELNESTWARTRASIATAIEMLTGHAPTSESWRLLAWKAPSTQEFAGTGPVAFNVFRHDDQCRGVDIRLSSIHAVKGQTHLATLLLETFHYDHTLKAVMPWLVGDNEGATNRTSERSKQRLRMAYVAMTRPTSLLCLAVRQSSLGAADQVNATKEKLIARGWEIVEL